LTAPGGSGPPGNPDDPGQPRKVFLGTVPDFAFAGSGVRVASVVPDSPAAKAGLVADDVIIEMNAAVIRDLKSYAEFLKTLKAGDRVTIGFLRAGLRQNTTATVIER
ncbi:MAG TPA: PDZ domain-containing protein, partial [Bdellovibrionota bacterium]|nr:PDZ domain-containing protein [Bdellovibrionota bacterium]